MNIPTTSITGVNPSIFEDLNTRTARDERRARQHATLRTAMSIISGGALILGLVLAAWTLADGPARAMHDYQRACEMGADCGGR